ncbi:hypothetical protein KI387_039455 [Taxus chinensis]|uniref:Uncharacterized protein n=1 Tax=Taxus chinensis TaxID=29808 RepID=A0AA38CFE1_TAXCH|nr:hypothetical protein KI387_039455 [Taxus chinensis]
MKSFDEEGAYPQMRKMLSWEIESHIDEPEFEVSQGALMKMPESKGDNPLVSAQQLSDEQVCNALNKVSVELEARLFGRNDRVKFLEAELEKREEELEERTKNLKQEELISVQLKHELREEKERVHEVYKKVESITDVIVLKHPDLAPPTQKYGSSLECLEDLTRILTMERQPLALESMEEVAAHLEKEEKLKVVAIISKYNKVLADVKIATHTVEATYDSCTDRDKVASILVTTHEVELKEFQEKNKGNRAEWERILAEVEKKSEAIETLRGSIKNRLKELYPQITRRMDALEDVGKELEGMVETLNTQGNGLGFEEVSTLVGDLCQRAQNEVDAWNKLEADLQRDFPILLQ